MTRYAKICLGPWFQGYAYAPQTVHLVWLLRNFYNSKMLKDLAQSFVRKLRTTYEKIFCFQF